MKFKFWNLKVKTSAALACFLRAWPCWPFSKFKFHRNLTAMYTVVCVSESTWLPKVGGFTRPSTRVCTCPCGFLARVFSRFWETPRHSHPHVSDRVFCSKIHKSFSHTPKLHKSWKCNSKHTWCWKLTPCILYDMKIKQREWQIDKHTTHASYWNTEHETQRTKIRTWVVSSLMYLVAQGGSLRWKGSLPSPWRSLPR